MTTPDDTDDVLLHAWQRQRDEGALGELCRRHATLVRAACRWQGSPDPDEAAQAVILVLARRAGSVPPGALVGWLLGIVRRVVGHQRRAKARRIRHEREAAMTVSATTAPTADEPAWAEARPHLADALASLSPGRREAVVRFYLQGKAQAEIAAELGCSVDAVKTRVHEGLERLRAFFARRGVALGGAALAAGLAHEAPAAEPALAEACLRAAITPGGPSAALASGVVTAMIIKTTALASAALIAIGTLLTVAFVSGGEAPPPVPVPQPVPPITVVPDDPGANATLAWYRAFIAMPAEESPIMQLSGRPSLEAAGDPVADETFQQPMPALDLLVRGAAAPYGDWGIDVGSEGAGAKLPYRSSFRPLVRLACLRACWYVKRNASDEAVAELTAVIRACRLFPGRRPMLFDVLSGIGDEATVRTTIGGVAPRLDRPRRLRLVEAMGRLPAAPRFADTLAQEAACFQWMIQRLRGMPVEERRTNWGSQEPAPTAEQVSDAGLDQAWAAYQRELARWRQVLSEPPSAVIAPLTTFTDGELPPHPLIGVFAIAIKQLRRSEVKRTVQHAQFLAALAVLDEGDAALARHPDPVTGRLFRKSVVDGGFVLEADVPGFKPAEIRFQVGVAPVAPNAGLALPQPGF